MKHFWKFNWPNITLGVIFAIMACFSSDLTDILLWTFVSAFNFILIICIQQGEKIENQERIIKNQEEIIDLLKQQKVE